MQGPSSFRRSYPKWKRRRADNWTWYCFISLEHLDGVYMIFLQFTLYHWKKCLFCFLLRSTELIRPRRWKMTIINGCHVSQKVWHAKELSLLNYQKCRACQNFKPFNGYGDLSKWVKNSRKTLNKYDCRSVGWPRIIWPENQ